MSLPSLNIKHATCDGCGRKKFVFTGVGNFCENCFVDFQSLVTIGRKLELKEILPGILADMADAQKNFEGNNLNAVSPAYKEAMDNYDRAVVGEAEYERREQRRRAEKAASLAFFRNLCELAPNEVKQASARVYGKVFDDTYWKGFLDDIGRHLHPK